MRKLVARLFTIFFMIFEIWLLSGNGYAQVQADHPFPRIGMFKWGPAPTEWWAKMDMVLSRNDDPDDIASVKQLNPNTLWLVMRDLNRGDEYSEFMDDYHEEWYLRDSSGNRLPVYSDNTFYADLSILCPEVEEQQLWEALAADLADIIDRSGADGFASDGIYYEMHLQWNMWDDVDLDRDGVNDLDQHGQDWVIEQWCSGVDLFFERLWSLFGSDHLVGPMNTGSSDTLGDNIGLLNGFVNEHFGGVNNFQYIHEHSAMIFQNTTTPTLVLMMHNPSGEDPYDEGATYFSFVRFGVGLSMLLGHYYMYEDAWDVEHFWAKYYDEMDLDVGYPTGDMQQVISLGDYDEGVWVRFFDGGAALVNVSGQPVTVTNDHLTSITGYDGPYYRFQGGQTPEFNNGELFESVELDGHYYIAWSGETTYAGDAIILVKQSTTVVADIIVDNNQVETSPPGDAAEFSGDWIDSDDQIDGAWMICHAPYMGCAPYMTGQAGDGEKTAVYHPVIGLAGRYEVFEWHPSSPSALASNVPCAIHHAQGTTDVVIDQTQNASKWNSLGTFRFDKGTSGTIQISDNANGVVAADAYRFVYKDNDGVQPKTRIKCKLWETPSLWKD